MTAAARLKAEQLLSVKDVAHRWQCNEYTVRREINRGNLPALKILGRHLVSPTALNEYERQHSAA